MSKPNLNNEAKLNVKIVPGSSKTGIAGWLGQTLKLRVTAKPEKGKANAAVVDLLASELGVHKRNVNITSGRTSTNKVVTISGLTDAELRERLTMATPYPADLSNLNNV